MPAYQQGSDYDLEAALQYNETGITLEQVAEVLAVVYGEHDDSDYFWVLQMADGAVGLLQGHHDYTGWDCQSSALWTPAKSPDAAVALAFDEYAGRPVREFLAEQLQGVLPEMSAHQIMMERMRKGVD